MLNRLSKTEFDNSYPDIDTNSALKGDPYDYCIYGNEIYLSPYLETVTTQKLYIYGTNVASVLSASDSLEYEDRFREIIKFGTLYRIYNDLDMDTQSSKYKGLYYEGLEKMINIDDIKNNDVSFTHMNLI